MICILIVCVSLSVHLQVKFKWILPAYASKFEMPLNQETVYYKKSPKYTLAISWGRPTGNESEILPC